MYIFMNIIEIIIYTTQKNGNNKNVILVHT